MDAFSAHRVGVGAKPYQVSLSVIIGSIALNLTRFRAPTGGTFLV